MSLSHFRRFCVVTIYLVLVFSADKCARATDFGINYDVTQTDMSHTAECNTDMSATVHGHIFITRYNDPGIRKTVRQQLISMHQSGFTVIRTILYLFPGINYSGDLINIGNIDDILTQEVTNYVSDVRAAGFRKFILSFGPLASAAPACRKVQWGDCFDPVTVPATVAAEKRLIAAANTVKGLSLRVDLLNEGCVGAAGPQSASANLMLFIKAASKMHAANFGNVPTTVSCQLVRAADGLPALQSLFIESGDRVGFFDLHAGPVKNQNETVILEQIASKINETSTPVIFGETIYGDSVYRQRLTDAYRAAFHHDPEDTLFWPIYSGSPKCNFEVHMPYTLKEAIGNLKPK